MEKRTNLERLLTIKLPSLDALGADCGSIIHEHRISLLKGAQKETDTRIEKIETLYYMVNREMLEWKDRVTQINSMQRRTYKRVLR